MKALISSSLIFTAGLSACTYATQDGPAPIAAPAAPKYLVNIDSRGLALQGYDPVAYFTLGKPTRGDPKFRSTYRGGTYQFATAEHKALFDKDPAKYEPHFGGYCGYAASINKVSPIDVEYWEILEGRLVLQHNKKAWDLWHKDVKANLAKADQNWPGLVEKNGAPEKILVNTDRNGLALEGYDPVAYFTLGKPTRGSLEHTATFRGATYRFASREHHQLFEKEPARYVPEFGGYCGYAASINKISPVNPEIWQLVDGKLVLQHTQEAYRLFNKDVQESYGKARQNWPGLVKRRGR
jgi:YHS domain-containing protein